MKKSRLNRVALVILIIPILTSACCNEIYSGKQTIDVNPLYKSPVLESPMLSLFHLEKYGITNLDSNYISFTWPIEDPTLAKTSSIRVILDLEKYNVFSGTYFKSECSGYLEDTSKFVFGGEGDNRYCISYVSEMRTAPEPFCQATGEYESYVVFQKGKLVITILEYSTDRRSVLKNSVISQLAEDLNPDK